MQNLMHAYVVLKIFKVFQGYEPLISSKEGIQMPITTLSWIIYNFPPPILVIVIFSGIFTIRI